MSDRIFLVGAHIARWADHKELRGDIKNGLCLCLLHDKAFEIGYFLLNDDLEIQSNPILFSKPDSIIKHQIIEKEGFCIRTGVVTPSKAAIKLHRKRILGAKP